MRSLLVLYMFFAHSVFSQVLILKYDDIPELILKNNTTVKTYEEKVNQNIYKEKELVKSSLPQLKLSARYSRLSKIDPFVIQIPFDSKPYQINVYEPVQNQYYSRLNLDYPVFTGLRVSNSIKAQSYFTKTSKEELKSIQSEVIYQTRELYLKLFLSYKTKKLLEVNKTYLESQKRTVENFVLNGLLTQNDLLRLDIALTKNQIALLELENAINLLNSNLCQILDIDVSTTIIPVVEIDSLILKQSFVDSYYDSPEIKALENLLFAQRYLKKASLNEFYPEIFFNAGFDYAKPNLKFFPVKNTWKYTWDVTLILQFSIWNWFAPKAKADQINSQIIQTELQIKNLATKQKIDYENLFKKIEIEKEKINLSRKELEHAQENLRQTENKFKEGLATTSDLLEANKMLVEAEAKFIESKIYLLLTYAEIKKLSGSY